MIITAFELARDKYGNILYPDPILLMKAGCFSAVEFIEELGSISSLREFKIEQDFDVLLGFKIEEVKEFKVFCGQEFLFSGVSSETFWEIPVICLMDDIRIVFETPCNQLLLKKRVTTEEERHKILIKISRGYNIKQEGQLLHLENGTIRRVQPI